MLVYEGHVSWAFRIPAPMSAGGPNQNTSRIQYSNNNKTILCTRALQANADAARVGGGGPTPVPRPGLDNAVYDASTGAGGRTFANGGYGDQVPNVAGSHGTVNNGMPYSATHTVLHIQCYTYSATHTVPYSATHTVRTVLHIQCYTYSVIQCDTVLHSATQCDTVLRIQCYAYSATHTVLHIQCYTYSATQCYTVVVTQAKDRETWSLLKISRTFV